MSCLHGMRNFTLTLLYGEPGGGDLTCAHLSGMSGHPRRGLLRYSKHWNTTLKLNRIQQVNGAVIAGTMCAVKSP
jgi:hypothetical protein